MRYAECFLECLQGGGTSKDPSGIGIHPVLYFLHALGLDECKIGSLGQESPDDAVVILVGAPLARAVRMCEIQCGPVALGQYRLLQSMDIGELAAIVERDREEYLAEQAASKLALQLVECVLHGLRAPVPYLDDQLHSRAPLHKGQQAFPRPILCAVDRIAFPVPCFQPAEDLLRPLHDGTSCELHVRMLPLTPMACGVFHLPFPRQVLDCHPRDVPRLDPVVQGLLADPQPRWPGIVFLQLLQYRIGAVLFLQDQLRYSLYQSMMLA